MLATAVRDRERDKERQRKREKEKERETERPGAPQRLGEHLVAFLQARVA
eukprot:COSAG03_NODE_18712_length_350_cov_0.533865_1_plen_49_part_10